MISPDTKFKDLIRPIRDFVVNADPQDISSAPVAMGEDILAPDMQTAAPAGGWKWRDHGGMNKWAYAADGSIVIPQNQQYFVHYAAPLNATARLPRSKGEPISMMNMRNDYGDVIKIASSVFDIPQSWLAGMISIEAARKPGFKWDPVSSRFEPGFKSWQTTPHRVSMGLMQTLLSTAQSMRDKYDHILQIRAIPRKLTPDILTDPLVSVLLGAAYMRHQLDNRHGAGVPNSRNHCFVLLCGSYNAGRLRMTKRNPWNIMTFGPTRIDKAIGFHNDWVYIEKQHNMVG